jgi:Rad3-related DNA helicase
MWIACPLHRRISSEPKHRTPLLYNWLGQFVSDLVPYVKDHTIIFVPSYEVITHFLPFLKKHLPAQYSIYREPSTGRISFLNELLSGDSSVILAVYGGKFAEGIELLHPETGRSRLSLLLLYGLPFPVPTSEHQFLYQFCHRKWKSRLFRNWAFQERIIITLVRQALGRAIRSDSDHAVAAILDYRIMKRHRIIPNLHWFRSLDRLKRNLQYRLQTLSRLI